ncbi:flagellar assembly protein FliW [Clostridium chauvoei]|uniref:Flagellar assembly factor FliW n=2 Tax=Clostridium chauvoei TaxID=46867 RepID=S6EJ24_9CLOT|nr:flagellar assembly protein FliW [Clostridium chauvoei]ATD54618.1 flagellar assembly protein FliW [Clostridium chauvoei]ATD57701.1 flagellar assembly protein FliW [Clostridium chauvoei]MBX7281030.1 flagellar assembly protein FliW [Clostridium chauvoei]MBX7283469.1 flagellar assembly protein FliW [Clostridium chauvoei]MBX7286119.1 flagellar assembly protein FliW [Clostridium chauvoei]
MEIMSPIHGKIIYSEEEIISFEKGLPGFGDLKQYVIKELSETPFNILQSIENEELAFVIMSPFLIENNYEVKLNEEIIKKLKIESPSDVMLYSIVTLNSDVKKITANLKAPLIINIKNKKGEQFIVDVDKYKIKHQLSI